MILDDARVVGGNFEKQSVRGCCAAPPLRTCYRRTGARQPLGTGLGQHLLHARQVLAAVLIRLYIVQGSFILKILLDVSPELDNLIHPILQTILFLSHGLYIYNPLANQFGWAFSGTPDII